MDKKLFRSIVILMIIASLLALTVIKIDTAFSILELIISVLTPVIAGTLITLFLDKPFDMFRHLFLRVFKKAKHKNRIATGLSVALTYISLFSFITVFLIAIIPEVTASITMLVENIASYAENIQTAVNSFINSHDILRKNFGPIDVTQWSVWLTTLTSKALDVIQTKLPEIFDITKSIAGGVTTAILSLIVSIYIMISRRHLKWQAKKLVYAFFPEKIADKIRDIANLTARTLSGYISGRVIDSIIVGILCFVFLKIFGFEYAALISFMVGVTNIIPMIGPFIGAIPSALLLLLVNPAHCLWFIIFIIILQQIDSNIIDPHIAGESTGLPTLWVLVSITFGGGLFGFMGFILSVPLCAVIYRLTRDAVIRISEKKNIPLDDEPDKDPPVKRYTVHSLIRKLRKKKKRPSEESK